MSADRPKSKKGVKRSPKKKSTKAPSMRVNLGGLKLANPVMTASGTFGYGLEFAPYLDLARLGGVVVKGLSPKPRPGNPGPRIVETPCGMLNAIGLQNVGVDAFIEEKLPKLRKVRTRVIANIFGESIADYVTVTRKLNEAAGVHAIEINISCPNVKKGGMSFGVNPKEAAKVVRAVRKATTLPVITKLSPVVADIAGMARAVEDAGSDAISLINTIPGMVIDIEKRTPVIARGIGGLSGPAIRPIAVRMVNEVYNAVSVPVVGIGGIMEAGDAIQFMIAGASAVQVGTASFVDPAAAEKIVDGIAEYLARHNITAKKLTGSLVR
ncbi:MAG: dihydroorotate dehydrogenase [Proteobacteria bacterium]|nr:dihydroorotate dehydrogenase [Pseudomonadota bacterium]